MPMALAGVVVSVTGNFDRQVLSSAVRKAGGRVDALVHKNLDYVREREHARVGCQQAWHFAAAPSRAVLAHSPRASMAGADGAGR